MIFLSYYKQKQAIMEIYKSKYVYRSFEVRTLTLTST